MQEDCTTVAVDASVAARFWAKVDVRGVDECWNWTASIDTPGYGGFKFRGRKVNSHRMAYHLSRGESAGPRLVLHSCDNRLCCNPAHLRLGTYRDNMADAKRRGRLCRGSQQGFAQLTESLVTALRTRAIAGESYLELAREIGVSPSTVRLACVGKSWGHVGGPTCGPKPKGPRRPIPSRLS